MNATSHPDLLNHGLPMSVRSQPVRADARLAWPVARRATLPLAAWLVAGLLAGCTAVPQATVPRMQLPERAGTVGPGDTPEGGAGSGTRFEVMPSPPQAGPGAHSAPPAMSALPPARPGPVQLNFEQVPLTTLIQVVYADVLGRTVQIDPKVMERRDLVTFRTPQDATPEQVESALQILLRSYGVNALHVAGLVRVLPDNKETGVLPEIRRGSALPETPQRLRPIFQLVELQAVRNVEVANWLKTLFGTRVNVQEDASRNAVVLSGTSENISAALDAIRVLDQPVMRGRGSLRVTPSYWSATELAQTLTQVLAAEGYSMPPPGQTGAQSGGVRYPVVLLPVAATNSMLVFSISDEVLAHVRDWIARLDQPNRQAAGRNLFTYTARHTSAESLARTIGTLLDGGTTAASATTGTTQGQAGAAGTNASATASRTTASSGSGRVVVDSNSNTLIFNTSAENYSQIIALLGTLDQPSKSALIEVTVAEIRLTDNLDLGIEWLLNESGARGSTTTAGTLGGLGLATGGLNITRLNSLGDTRLVLNALATNNRATILSSPRVMARNGEAARIQVGQEVPVITSQQTGVVGGTNSNSGVLQTVQYRNTGVILSVKPSIFSGDRIDLDVTQEVSAAQATQTGVNISPTIATRKVETKLTLEHGSTVLLAGLISDDRTDGNSGVPWLQDIPLLGRLFRSDSQTKARTELVVLITPYIISDGKDARDVTNAFRDLVPLLSDQLSNLPAGTEPGARRPALPARAGAPAVQGQDSNPATPKK